MGINEFELLKKVKEISQPENVSQKNYVFDGIVYVSNTIFISKKDGTRETPSELKFFILNIGEVFYRLKKLKQFFTNFYNIDYETFKEHLDVHEKEIFGKYFGKKKKLYKEGIKLSKEDNIFVSDQLVIPVLDTQKNKYILSIENYRIINDMSNLIVDLIQKEQKVLLDKNIKNNQQKGTVLFGITKTDEGLKLSYKIVKLGNVDSILEDIYDLNYEQYLEGINSFVTSSKNNTENNINEIIDTIIGRMESIIQKYDDENSDVVNNIVNNVNTSTQSINSKKIIQKQRVEKEDDSFINVDDVLSELTSNTIQTNQNVEESLNDLLMNDEDENSNIPF